MGNLTAKTSGEIANFMTPAKTNIKSLKVYFSPKQLGTGDPSPENVREILGWEGVKVNGSGRNLLQNANGSLSYLHLKKGTTITISQSMDSNVGYFRGYDINKTTNTPLVWINQKNNGKRRWSEYTLEDDIYYAVCYTGTGMKEAQITLDGSVDYEPYQGNTISYQWKLPDEYQEVEYIESTGTQAILTDIPCQLPLKTDIDIMFTSNNDSYFCGTRYGNIRICSGGNYQTNVQWAFGTYRLTNGINLNTRYLLSTYLDNGNQLIIKDNIVLNTYQYTISDNDIKNIEGNLALFAMWLNDSQTFGQFAKAKCYGIRISNNNKMLGNFVPCYRKSDNEIGMYDTVSQTFYTNQGTGTFLKGNDVDKTFYGGYVDLINGELTEEWFKHNLQTSVKYTKSSAGYNGWWFTVTTLGNKFQGGVDSTNPSTQLLSNVFTTNTKRGFSNGTNMDYVIKTWGGSTGANISQFCFSGFSSEDIEDFYSFINQYKPVICYKLATPITHQLTPTQLKSFVGQNNFWSNADYVEIEYDLIETIDIQKAKQKIILNQPHIESIKDDLINFTTNMKAPLKECKVYFNPIQEGSGDPSPDNVRNIIGWDGINVCSSDEITLFNSFSATSGRTSSGIDNNKRITTNSYGTTINRTDSEGIKTELIITQTVADSTKERYQNGYISLFPNTDKLVVDNTYYFDADIEIISNPLNKLPEMMLTDDAGNRWTITITDGKLHESFVWKERPTVYQYPFIEFYCNGCSFKLNNMVITPTREIKTVNWSNPVGTVYGGYVDLAKGELVATQVGVRKKLSEANYKGQNSNGVYQYNFNFAIPYGQILNKYGSQKCNVCGYSWNMSDFQQNHFFGYYNESTGNRFLLFLLEDHGLSDDAEIDFMSELISPVTFQLTPQQLLTFKGENNIWSDTNGQTEVKFWIH